MERHVKLNPACTWCGTTKGPEAHHIIPVHVDPSGAADPANLRTFCRRCHFTVGHGNDWLKYVIPLPDPRPVLP